LVRAVGRVVALAGCLATAVSWGWVLWLALFGREETNLALLAIATLMMALSIAGANAALVGAYGVMYAVSIAWLVPFGLYLFASGAWYVGASILLYLLGAAQVHLGSVLERLAAGDGREHH